MNSAAGKCLFILALMIAALLAGCGHRARPVPTLPNYTKALANAKRAGLVVSMAEMQAKLPPASENAAPLYTQLNKLLREKPLAPQDEIINSLSSNSIPSAKQLSEARAALARRSDVMRLVHAAATRPRCVFVRDWTNPDPGAVLFPELATIRNSARYLTAESLAMAADGQGAAAVRNEALGFQIAQHGDSDHTVISYLVDLAVNAITLAGMQRIIYITHGNPQVARAVQQSIERDWKPESLAASMRSESAFQQGIIMMFRRDGPGALGDTIEDSKEVAEIGLLNRLVPNFWPRYVDRNGAYLLGVMPKVVASADQPYPQAHAAMQKITADVMRPKDATHSVAKVVLPDLVPLVEKRALLQARANATRAGAAVLSYRSAHGAFPAMLAQAVSSAPRDPYDLKPLRYKREGAGFVVYSIGSSGHFDGGGAAVKPKGVEAFFRYPAPLYDAANDATKPLHLPSTEGGSK